MRKNQRKALRKVEKPSKDAPKTGDNTNLLLWLIVLGMSLSGVVVLGRKIKEEIM